MNSKLKNRKNKAIVHDLVNQTTLDKRHINNKQEECLIKNADSSDTVYFALEQSILVENQAVCIKDIASIFCINPDINFTVKNIPILDFPKCECGQEVITAMKLIEFINTAFKNVNVVNIGEPQSIIYYKSSTKKSKALSIVKAIFLFLIAFLGSAFSIMAYNLDVNTRELLTLLHELFIGEPPYGPTIAVIAYSLGLFIGVVVFFNHGMTGKLTDDPTPLQIQMRLYETECNTAISIDSTRHKETIDVD